MVVGGDGERGFEDDEAAGGAEGAGGGDDVVGAGVHGLVRTAVVGDVNGLAGAAGEADAEGLAGVGLREVGEGEAGADGHHVEVALDGFAGGKEGVARLPGAHVDDAGAAGEGDGAAGDAGGTGEDFKGNGQAGGGGGDELEGVVPDEALRRRRKSEGLWLIDGLNVEGDGGGVGIHKAIVDLEGEAVRTAFFGTRGVGEAAVGSKGEGAFAGVADLDEGEFVEVGIAACNAAIEGGASDDVEGVAISGGGLVAGAGALHGQEFQRAAAEAVVVGGGSDFAGKTAGDGAGANGHLRELRRQIDGVDGEVLGEFDEEVVGGGGAVAAVVEPDVDGVAAEVVGVGGGQGGGGDDRLQGAIGPGVGEFQVKGGAEDSEG